MVRCWSEKTTEFPGEVLSAPSVDEAKVLDHGVYVGRAKCSASAPLPGGSVGASGGGSHWPSDTLTSNGLISGEVHSASVTSPMRGMAGVVIFTPRSTSIPAYRAQQGELSRSASTRA